MRRFGIRALACGLAVMLVAGLGAPAVASAEDVLLISPAPSKAESVLHITADMVDDDGEIVISGGNYDRVIVSKEAAAKDIYFDQVTVGELVVEGGNKANVQLWEVDAEKVTVQEPQLEKLSLLDLLPLLKDPETRDAAVEMYQKSLAKDNYALSVAPTIVTMEDAKVDELVTRTNVKLDLGAGEVGEVALEASAKQNRVNVTLSNYEGNVSYKGGDGFSSVTLKSVDSRIKNLKVDESNANNYFTVTGKETVVLNTEVAGNANVALNAMMGAVKVTEEATAANLTLLNVAEELTVAGKGANIQLSGNANVTFATVTSDDVKISGVGTLGEADLQGKGAYVSTFGTKVEGENTYIPYTIPLYDSWSEDFSDETLVEGVPTDGPSMNWATYAYDAEGGFGIATTKAGWEGFAIELNNRDNGSSANFVITLKAKKLGGTETAVRVTENPAWPNLGKQVTLSETGWTTITSDKIPVAAGASRVILIAPVTGQDGVTLQLAVDDIKVDRYTEWTEPPARPKPTENVTYNFGEMTISNMYGCTPDVKDGALHISYEKQYQEVQYKLPKGMFSDDYDRIVVDFADCVGTITFKIVAGGKTIKEASNKDGDCIIDLSDVPGYEVTNIGIMQSNAGSGNCNAVINGFTFVVAGTDYELPAEPPKAPGELSEDYLVYDMATLVPDAELTDIGGLELSYTGQYQQTNFTLPEAINVADYEKMIITVSSATDQLAFKVYAGGTEAHAWYNNAAGKTTDIAVNLSEVPNQETVVTAVAVMSQNGPTDAIVYRVAFVPKKANPSTPEVEGDTYTFGQFGDAWYMDPTGVSYTIENGSAVVNYTEAYKAVQFGFNWLIPDTTEYSKMIINYEAPNGGLIVKAWQTGEQPDANYNSQIMGTGNASATATDLVLDITGATASIEKVDLMSTSGSEYTVKVNSITFVKEKAPEFEVQTYTFGELGDAWYMDPTGVSYTIENGSAVVNYTEAYKAVQFGFNWLVPDTTEYLKIIINYEAPNGGIIVKAWQTGEQPDANYNSQIMGNGDASATATDLELDITGATASIEKVDLMSASGSEYTVKVNSISFVKVKAD